MDWGKHLRLAMAPIPRRRKLERQRYVTRRTIGPFPAGTPCIVSRARPDSFLVLEFDDGSVAEVSFGVCGLEVEPSWLTRLLCSEDGQDSVVWSALLMARLFQWEVDDG